MERDVLKKAIVIFSQPTNGDSALEALAGRYPVAPLCRRCRLGNAQPHAAGSGTCSPGDGRCTPVAKDGGAAAFGLWKPILRL